MSSSYLDDFFDRRKIAREKSKVSPEDAEKAKNRALEEQRQRIISYKQFFGEPHGQEVMLDLMNRFHILTPLPDTSDALALARAEGKREVVLYLLKRANVDMAALDKILKGEFI